MKRYIISYINNKNEVYHLDLSEVASWQLKEIDESENMSILAEKKSRCTCSPDERDIMRDLGNACKVSCGFD